MTTRRSDESLTETFCKHYAEVPTKGHVIYFDRELKGFGLRVTAKGHRSFILRYRMGSKQRQYEIGKFPQPYSATKARIEANTKKAEVLKGIDPITEKKEGIQKALEAEARLRTVRDLATAFMQKHVLIDRRDKTAKEYQRQIDNHILPQLGLFTVSSVTTGDINERIRIPLRATPYLANRIVALVGTMFNWARTQNAAAWDLVNQSNPAEGVERYREEPRESYLTEDEMQQLLRVLDEFPQRSVEGLEVSTKQKRYLAKEAKRISAAVELLFLTGSRMNEVLGAKWSEFDLQREQWNRPTLRNKQKRPERVPLSDDAVVLLKSLPKESEFVFPGRNPEKPLTDISGAWKKIREAAGLPDLRLHDLRHNYASWLVSEGESLPQVGRLLGHSQPSTTMRYVSFQNKTLRKTTNHFAAITRRRADAPTPAQR